MSSRFKDFDAYWAEQAQEPIRIRVFGQVEELPPSLPLAVMLRAQRIVAGRSEGEEVPAAELLGIAADVFGQERVERWAAKGMTIEQMMDVFQYVQAIYSGQAPAEGADDEGNVGEPRQEARQGS